ncbi:MAG: indolepyruvate ferredoxin oxidoreductase [Bacteroidetes bacterium 4572_112]|nr:MAG: indolepyruvate ferredoxin oxidoreductase [Bacteroidetes bacterium 4572_112]
MQKAVLLGDEAIAQGALDAGVSAVYAYPGTPSTEINEYILRSKEHRSGNVVATWTTNEKTSMEMAIGASYVGKRALVTMKHVGLNVAADPFMNVPITGVNGGLVIVSADDPSMHSSQNEQDSRYYGKFAQIPVLEPINQQQAYDMMPYAFEMSERLNAPVLMRITTRLAHSRAGISFGEKTKQNELALPKNRKQFVLLPSIARVQYKDLLNNWPNVIKESETAGYNKYLDGKDKSMGIITTGIAYNYLMENYPEGIDFPILQIAQYPLPTSMVQRLYDECDTIMVLEEGYPIVEEGLRGILDNGKTIFGRLDGTLPRDGELNPNLVAKAMGFEIPEINDTPEVVTARPPALCAGCPHTDSYTALNMVMEQHGDGRVFSDIGCYTLAALAPLESINTTVDMGASITMAKGAADMGLIPSVAVIGDSTFTHSGMTGLLDAVNAKSPITVMILDNFTTGMTGGQQSQATGKLEAICEGLGVEKEHIRILNPIKKYHDENTAVMKEELEYNGVSVIIPRRECVITLNARLRAAKNKKKLEKANKEN